jgi:hypothetical protein
VALDGTQRARIRKYLGWEARFHQVQQDLEQALDAIAVFPDDEVEVLAELQRCIETDEQILKVRTTALAIQDGAIHLRAHYQLGVLRSIGKGHVRRIANILGVAVRNGGAFRG